MFDMQDLCRQLETETDQTTRRMLVRLVADHCRTLAKSVADQDEIRILAVKELGHRLKNQAAIIQSIVAYQLRDHETTRDAILRRLSALSALDMAIETAQGRGAFIKDIVEAELGPYDRATVEGPQIFLPPRLALVLGLIFHELATNAAKHGALSKPSGHISFCWWIAETKLMLEWREGGGPTVTIPTHQGFGTRLLSRVLSAFDGTVDNSFAPTGLVCTMSLALVPGMVLPASSGQRSLTATG